MESKVMPMGFTPRQRGRKPRFDIKPLLDDIEHNTFMHGGQRRWSEFTLSAKDARSAKRQLETMGTYKVSMDTQLDGIVRLYVLPL